MSENQTAVTSTVNFVPVQGTFQPAPGFELISLIGPAGTPFYASISPNQSGLNITNSTINSTTIGATTPSTAAFTAGTVVAAPVGATDIANKQYVDYYAAGLSWKAPVTVASMANIAALSGLLTIDTVTLAAGETVLVKNQTNAADNGIYVASAGAWTRSIGADVWEEFIGAIVFVVEGTQTGSAWFCTAQPGGTLGVTALNWSNFSVASTYTAGTGLTLAGTQFSITPAGTAGTYGAASSVPVFVTNASGQVTSVTNTSIAIANTAVSGLGTMSTQDANAVAITGGTINGTTIGGSTAAAVTGTTITANTQFTGAGTGLTGTASALSIGGNAATATSATSATTATTATNIAGGATGSLPYQSATSTTVMLAAGSNGQVLTLATGVPSWATPTTGTVTSVGGTGTVSGISLSGTVTSTGNLTLGGTLDLSAPPAIGGATAAAITGTTITANTKFVGTNFDASGSGGGALRNSSGAACLQWGAGGGVNLTLDGAFNMNPANATISIAPTGTGTITINPATAGTINNVSIGATTAAAGWFTTLAASSTVSANGSVGTAGQMLTSAGAGSPATWTTPASAISVTDDTTTNATRYPLFAAVTTGNLTAEFTSSTRYQFNPSTGALTTTSLTPTNALGIAYGGTGATTLAGASIATYTGSETLTNKTLTNPTVTNYVESVVAIGTVTTTNTIALTNGTVQTATLTASTACTFTMPANVAGKSFVLLLKQAAATGNGTATFTSVKWGTAGAPTITATAGKMDILTFIADGTNWYGSIAQGYTP